MDEVIKFELQGEEPVSGRPPFATGARPSPTGLQWVCSPTNRQNSSFRLDGSILQHVEITTETMTVKNSVGLSASPIHVACSSHGSLVAVACVDGSLKCYDGDLTERWTIPDAHSHVVTDLSETTSSSRSYGASASGGIRSLQICGRHLLLVDSKENKLKIWNATLEQPQELVGSTLCAIKVSAAAFSCVANRDGSVPLAIGDVEGKVHLYQFTPRTGSFARKQEPTAFPREGETGFACTHLDWFDPSYLAAGYCRVTEEEQDPDDEDDSSGHEAAIFVAKVDQDVWDNATWTDLDDVVGFFSVPQSGRHAYSTCFVPTKESAKLLFVVCNVGTDVGVLVQESEDEEWRILDLEEGCGATTPTDDDDEYTYPVGMTAVFDDGGLSLLLPSTDGRLSRFSCVNTEDSDFFKVPETKTIATLPSTVGVGDQDEDDAPELEDEEPFSGTTFGSGQNLFGGATSSSAFGSTSSESTPLFGATSTSGSAKPAFGQTSSLGSTGSSGPFLGQSSSLGSQGSSVPAFGQSSSLGSATSSTSSFVFLASSGGEGSSSPVAPSSNPFAPAATTSSAVFGSGSGVPAFGSGASAPIFGSSSRSSNSFANIAKAPAFSSSSGFGSSIPMPPNSPFGAFAGSSLPGQSAMVKPLFGSPAPAPTPAPAIDAAQEATSEMAAPHKVEPKETQGTEDHRKRLIELYTKYNPDKLDSVDSLLEKYKGREDVLFKKIDDKYKKGEPQSSGGTPPSPATPRASGGRPLVAIPEFMVKSLPTEQEAMELFDKFDEDCNQILSYGELSKLWKQLRKSLDHKITVMKAYHIADANQDGMLKRDEFEMFVRVSIYYDNCYDEFGTKPGRHALRLSMEEFRLVAPKFGIRHQDSDKVFELMDDNNSKYVTYEEFCSWMAKNTCEWPATVETAKSPKASPDTRISKPSTPTGTPKSSSRLSGIPTPTARTASASRTTSSSSLRSLGTPLGPSGHSDKLELKFAGLEDDVIEGHRKKLESLFQKYNPTKLDSVEHLLVKYKGRYPELYAKIDRKYNKSNEDTTAGSGKLVSLPAFATGSLPSEEDAMRMFDELDQNNNDTLSYGELGKVWARFFKRFEHKVSLMKAYNIADKNQDGMVKRDEFEIFLRVCVYYHNCFDTFGASGRHSQRLSLEEFRIVAPNFGIRGADMVFELMDDNNSRYVTFEEFCSWLARNTCEWLVTTKGDASDDLAGDATDEWKTSLDSGAHGEGPSPADRPHPSPAEGKGGETEDTTVVPAPSSFTFSRAAAAPTSAPSTSNSFSFGSPVPAPDPTPFSFLADTKSEAKAPAPALGFSFGTNKRSSQSDLQGLPAAGDREEIAKESTVVAKQAGPATGYPPLSGKAPVNPYSARGSQTVDDVSEHRKRLIALFSKYNPAKLDSVEELLEKYKGRYPHLYSKIERKYNPQSTEEPTNVHPTGTDTVEDVAPEASKKTGGQDDEPMATPHATAAARIFDERDKEGSGTLPLALLEELIDELGEGFSGKEFEAQKALIDPDGTGTIARGAFISWYADLLEQDASDSRSLGSEELQEREEEKAKVHRAFMKLATDDWIATTQFGELFESIGTTYCEEEHQKTLGMLADSKGRIHWEKFSVWYVEWLFGDDAEGVEGGIVDAISGPTPPAVTEGWGDAFKALQKGWRCDQCTSRNDEGSTKCASCEAARPGYEDVFGQANKASSSPAVAAIGDGGFSFGAESSSSKTGFSFGAPPGGFSFGAPASSSKTGVSFGAPAKPSAIPTTSNALDGAAPTVNLGFSFGSAATAADAGNMLGNAAGSSLAPKATTSSGIATAPSTTSKVSPTMSYPPMSLSAPKNPIGAATENSKQDPAHRQKLVELFTKYNPSKLDSVDSLLEKYRGREDVLYKKIDDKYNKSVAESVSATKTQTTPKQTREQLGINGTKAADVFDSRDSQKEGVLPTGAFEAMIDELGEGFSAGELEVQLLSIDPEGNGVISREAFIGWYTALVENDTSGDGQSVDSEEQRERAEELERVRRVFNGMATGDSISAADFPRLFKLIGTTFCEEEHTQTLALLTENGRIYWAKFSKWYIDWLFGDEIEPQDEDEPKVTQGAVFAAKPKGWGDVFKDSQSGWKCDKCMLRNDEGRVKCASCEAPRPGSGGSVPVQVKDATAGTIGAGGFSFGVKPPKEAGAELTGTGKFSFGFEPAKDESASSKSTGGFSFGGKSTKESGTVPSNTSFSFAGKPSKDGNASSKDTGGFSFGGKPTKEAGAELTGTRFSFGGKPVATSEGNGGFSFGGKPANEARTESIDTSRFSFGTSSQSAVMKPGAISVSEPPLSNAPIDRLQLGSTEGGATASAFMTRYSSQQTNNFQLGPRSTTSSSQNLTTGPLLMPKVAAEQTQDNSTASVPEVNESSFASLSLRQQSPGQSQWMQSPPTVKPPQSGGGEIGAVGKPPTSSPMLYPPLPGRAPVNPFGKPPSEPDRTEEYKKKLTNLFKKYNPAKLDTIEDLLVKYRGREEHLFNKIETKYSGRDSALQGPSGQPTALPEQHGDAYQRRLSALFTKYDQSKLTKVDALLKKYAGQEEALIKKLEAKYIARLQQSSVPPTDSVSPRLSKGEQRAPREGPKSPYEAQLRFAIERFKSSILSLNTPDRSEDDLSGRVEKLQKLKDSLLNSLMQSMEKVDEERANAVFIGSRKVDTSRLVEQAKGVLSSLVRTESVEQLDSASERSRRHVAAGSLRVHRGLESLKDTLRLLEGSSTEDYYFMGGPSQRSNEAFFDYSRESFDRNETFNEMANRKLKEARRLAEKVPERNRLDSSAPAMSRTPQGKLVLRPLRGTGKTQSDPASKPQVALQPFTKWRSAESSFRQLKPLTPKTLQIALPLTKKQHEQVRLKVLQKSHHQFLASKAPTSQSTRATKPHPSSSETLPVRPAWDVPFAIDQARIKPLSAGLTPELKEIHAVDAARDALAAYGTTPEKVSKVLDTKKRGDMGSTNPAAQKVTTAKGTVPLPSKGTAAPADSGAPGAKKSAPSKNTPSGYPPLSKEVPKPAVAGLSRSDEDKQLPPKPLVPVKPLVTPGKLESSSFLTTKGLGDSSLFTPSKPASLPVSKVDDQRAPDVTAGPDYNKMLTDFYAKHNPSKVGEVSKTLEKYKGRESEMFGRLAKKYNVANPMDNLGSAASFGGPQYKSAASSPFTSQSQGSRTTPFGVSDAKVSIQPFGSASNAFNSAPSGASFGSGQPSQPAFGQTPFSTPKAPSTPFGAPPSQTPAAPFGNTAPPVSTFGGPPAGTPTTPFGVQPVGPQSTILFNGKTPRELLTAFYQEKNPSKIGDVEKLLTKYAGKEENMFRNLAKKYNLSPTVFGISATAAAPSPGGFGQTSQLGGGGFGQPSPLGGGSVFGQTTLMGGGGGGFGSSSAFGAGSTSFGSLANNTKAGASPFGAAPGPAPAFGGAFGSSGFGSSPFGQHPNPFGAPRR